MTDLSSLGYIPSLSGNNTFSKIEKNSEGNGEKLEKLIFFFVCVCAAVNLTIGTAFAINSIKIAMITPGNRPPTWDEITHTFFVFLFLAGFACAALLYFPIYVRNFLKNQSRVSSYEVIMFAATIYLLATYTVFLA
ncbi:hypothetical protein [Ruegeria sp. EL01]|jgi:hypothetical protein|uniref:hypothetical protein n=1 Tax=Ruegeria sp. EL01 TaxID=2107578 RepID=UPI0013C42954|nr:hypothetical protein [Ruegeria sp. EL01]